MAETDETEEERYARLAAEVGPENARRLIDNPPDEAEREALARIIMNAPPVRA